MIHTQEEIKAKGFNMVPAKNVDELPFPDTGSKEVDFTKIRVGMRTLEDAVIQLGSLLKNSSKLANKDEVLRAIAMNDLKSMREISNYFYRISGIYSRLCKYLAYLYKYDWVINPYVESDSVKTEKVLEGFSKASRYLENFGIKKYLGDTALKVIRNGCYYGYRIPGDDRMNIQELPVDYCRSRFQVNGRPTVEFQMKYFDVAYKDTEQRLKILNLFPNDFKKGYVAFKEGKLPPQFSGDTAGWYLLDPEYAFKFNINNEDFPLMISVIPALIDLDAAQDLDRRKMAQQLLKIIIQKMPIDKNGDLVFDIDEATELHNNVVRMLGKAIGVDVLTTFADVQVADMADNSTVSSVDQLDKVERTVYNESGTAQNLFNADGNVALQKSILNDEASIYNLILQFELFLNDLLKPYNKNPKKLYYKVTILPTTIYNYQDLAKLYKEQMQLGLSKFLPAVALGQTQTSILAAAYFENDMLNLNSILIPPMSSNTMNAQTLEKIQGDEKKVGRTEKSDDEKSDKTLQNLESLD